MSGSISDPKSEQTTREWPRAVLLLSLVGLFAVRPLIVHGCSCGHDFDFHVLSWLEAATQIAHGNVHPQWAFTPAYNAGEPRFVFYPPLSWEIGATLGLILPWTWTPIVYTWLALTLAGLGCFWLLRDFVPAAVALAVASLAMVNPYTLFTAYERTAYGELLCAAWFPLLLHGILRERVTIPRLALPMMLLWLSNAPAAVLGCYSLALLAAVRLVWTLAHREKAGDFVQKAVAGTALGIGLAAFYILPAAVERRSIEEALDRAQSLLITHNFLFARTTEPDHDAVLHTASLLAVGLLTATALALLASWRQAAGSPHLRRTVCMLAALAGAIAFLLTPASTPIWLHAPQLAFLQFPWRFLAMLAPALALAFALALPGRASATPRRWIVATGIVLAAVLTMASYANFHQECDAGDTVAARVALYRSGIGTEASDDYTPMSADNDLLGKSNPPFWLAAGADDPAPAASEPGVLHGPIDVTSRVAQMLILNLREFPAWRLTLNGHELATRIDRQDGLMAIPIAAGASHLEIAYAQTPDRTAGWIVSIASFVVLAILLLRRRSR